MVLREGQSRRLKRPCFIKQMHTTRSSANNGITDIQQKRSALVFSLFPPACVIVDDY